MRELSIFFTTKPLTRNQFFSHQECAKIHLQQCRIQKIFPGVKLLNLIEGNIEGMAREREGRKWVPLRDEEERRKGNIWKECRNPLRRWKEVGVS